MFDYGTFDANTFDQGETSPMPFSQGYLAPASIRRTAPVPTFYNSALFAAVVVATPFVQQTLPPVKKPVAAPVIQTTFNPNLFKNAFPFNQTDWAKPARIRKSAFDLSVSLNPNIFTNAFPHNQYDYSKPIRLRKAPFDLSLPSSQLLTNLFPINQYDYLKPFRAPRASVQPPDTLNLNLFTNPVPIFNSFPAVKPPRPVPDASQPYNQNVYSVVVSLPFNQYDWSKSARVANVARDLSTPFNPNLAPVVVTLVPFNQFDFTPVSRVRAFPGALPSQLLPLIFPPIGPTAVKVISLDAAYGSADVTRFFRVSIPSNVVMGDQVAVLIDVGEVLDPRIPLNMIFTKPDGTTLVESAYIGRPAGFTGKGIFEESTYGVCVLLGTQVDQHGFWSCFLQTGTFASTVQQFYIGPPTVLV